MIPLPGAVQRQSFAAAVQGPRGLIASPFQFIVTGEDNLEVTSINAQTGVTVRIDVRVLDEATQQIIAFSERHVPNTDRTAARSVIALQPGAVLNLRVIADAGSPLIGQTFIIIRIVRGLGAARIALGTLLQGYITGSQDLGWPGSPIESSIVGGGYQRVIGGTDPPAGGELSETVPTGALWELVDIRADLATDATAGNRTVILRFDDGTTVYFRSPAAVDQAPSTTVQYNWATDATPQSALGGQISQGYLPKGPLLHAGHKVTTSVQNKGANDNWTAPVYAVREWLEAQ